MTKNQALSYFVSRGWTVPQAAGIVANLVAESALNPSAVGDGGAAYGIAQWHPDRQAGFEKLFGRPIRGSSVEDQLVWVDTELRTTERSAGLALEACVTAAAAGACISEKYERPADRAGESAKRAKLAESIAQGYEQPDTQPAAPIDDRSTVLPKQPEKHMGALALLQLFGPILSNLVPQIAPLLGAKGEKVTQYAGVAKTVLDTITATTGAPNLQGAVEAMSADPAMKAKVQAAVVSHEDLVGLLEIGVGGIAAARVANADPNQVPFYKNPGFVVACLLIPLIYIVVSRVMFADGYSEQLKTVVVTAILSGLLGALTGFYFGSSLSSARKDDALANKIA